jgi:hypothetical protein
MWTTCLDSKSRCTRPQSVLYSAYDSQVSRDYFPKSINTLNAELNPICHLLVLLGAHSILHVSRIRVKALALIKQTLIFFFVQ